MNVYLDESGFTGDDLLQADQPVFICASTTLEAADAQALLDATIGPLRQSAAEHKHSRLVRTAAGQARVVAFIRALAAMPEKAAYFTTFKRFALLAKLVDNWVEPAMFETAYDLYANAGARAMANMLYFCLRGFEGESRFDELLRSYQTFSRNLTVAGYLTFLSDVERLQSSVRNAQSIDLFGYIIVALGLLGPEHMQYLSNARSNDIAFGSVFRLIAYWDAVLKEPFGVVHDQSKNINRIRTVLEAVMSTTSEQTTVAFDDRMSYQLPLRATGVVFGDSVDYPQLQVCDLLAGAASTLGQWLIDRDRNPTYASALFDVGIENMSIGLIIPDLDDISARGPAPTGAANPLEVMTRLIREAADK